MSSIHTPDDLDALQITAEALGISEYQTFVEAYRNWHGSDPKPRRIDVLFARYLSRGEVPLFVRHFARHYLAAHPEHLQLRNARLQAQLRAQRIAFMLIVAIVASVLLFF